MDSAGYVYVFVCVCVTVSVCIKQYKLKKIHQFERNLEAECGRCGGGEQEKLDVGKKRGKVM